MPGPRPTVGLATLLVVAACSSGRHRPVSTSTASTSTASTASTVAAGDADNGKTITVPLGHVLVVTLNASNWTFAATSNPAVLSQTGATTQHRTACVPGGTCGTTTATFTPHHTGASQVIAIRNYCGEAIQCTPATEHWAITVAVTSR